MLEPSLSPSSEFRCAPIVANFFLEYFEKRALGSAVNKQAHWYRHADNSFVIMAPRKERAPGFPATPEQHPPKH